MLETPIEKMPNKRLLTENLANSTIIDSFMQSARHTPHTVSPSLKPLSARDLHMVREKKTTKTQPFLALSLLLFSLRFLYAVSVKKNDVFTSLTREKGDLHHL